MAWATNPSGTDELSSLVELPLSDAQSVRIMPLDYWAAFHSGGLSRSPRHLIRAFRGVRHLTFDPRSVQLGSHVSALGLACQAASSLPAGSQLDVQRVTNVLQCDSTWFPWYQNLSCCQPLVRSVAGCRESGLADSPRAAL